VFWFLEKAVSFVFDEHAMIVTDEAPTKDNETLHKTIKKVADDIENFSFNTSVSQFMICVNELTAQGCHSRAVGPLSRYFPIRTTYRRGIMVVIRK
jgi:leucyl-tRNA synthetase